jgi:hypothetical protein
MRTAAGFHRRPPAQPLSGRRSTTYLSIAEIVAVLDGDDGRRSTFSSTVGQTGLSARVAARAELVKDKARRGIAKAG